MVSQHYQNQYQNYNNQSAARIEPQQAPKRLNQQISQDGPNVVKRLQLVNQNLGNSTIPVYKGSYNNDTHVPELHLLNPTSAANETNNNNTQGTEFYLHQVEDSESSTSFIIDSGANISTSRNPVILQNVQPDYTTVTLADNSQYQLDHSGILNIMGNNIKCYYKDNANNLLCLKDLLDANFTAVFNKEHFYLIPDTEKETMKQIHLINKITTTEINADNIDLSNLQNRLFELHYVWAHPSVTMMRKMGYHIDKQAELLIRSCPVCAAIRAGNPVPKHHLTESSQYFNELHLDTLFHKWNNKQIYIVTIIHRHSRYLFSCSTSKKDNIHNITLELLKKLPFRVDKLYSDSGTEFSKLEKHYKMEKTSPGTHDGLIERVNQTLKKMLLINQIYISKELQPYFYNYTIAHSTNMLNIRPHSSLLPNDYSKNPTPMMQLFKNSYQLQNGIPLLGQDVLIINQKHNSRSLAIYMGLSLTTQKHLFIQSPSWQITSIEGHNIIKIFNSFKQQEILISHIQQGLLSKLQENLKLQNLLHETYTIPPTYEQKEITLVKDLDVKELDPNLSRQYASIISTPENLLEQADEIKIDINQLFNALSTTKPFVPSSYKEAETDEIWIKAITNEKAKFLSRSAFKPISLPPDFFTNKAKYAQLRSFWRFNIKQPSGKEKARFIVCQDKSQYQNKEFSSPTIRELTMKLLFAIYTSNYSLGDISNAYLHASIQTDKIFVIKTPRAFRNDFNSNYLQVQKAAYGLTQSGLQFYNFLKDKFINKLHFQPTDDPCVHVQTNAFNKNVNTSAQYVDDLFSGGNKVERNQVFKDLQNEKVELNSDVSPYYFIGHELDPNESDESLKVSMGNYITQYIENLPHSEFIIQNPLFSPFSKNANFLAKPPNKQVNLVDTEIANALVSPTFPIKNLDDNKLIYKINGFFSYLVSKNRFDIKLPLSITSRYNINQNLLVLEEQYVILRYLYNSSQSYLLYKNPLFRNPTIPIQITTYSDASFSKDSDSYAAHIIMIQDSIIDVQTTRLTQSTISTSSAELLALFTAVQTTLMVQEQLLSMNINTLVPIVFCDNKPLIDAINPKFNTFKYSYFGEFQQKLLSIMSKVQNGELIVQKIDSANNKADVFTKVTNTSKYNQMMNNLLGNSYHLQFKTKLPEKYNQYLNNN
ncbi:Transposon Ty2-C Gag-Pol polyprotein [Wickerhamomyces ciferrii]|uniref:Transposon Ty2-C Gag-Pol polyprotein n=1 Tax=Wickerhamomyces ciferrii (strain ATCC 14091 / BCRC 22168 / CBS 111 / JCM 3599 / NBRC 0793 / NRRL Y-1031 F-60-10) TaxID=1206466 RepID=K0KVP7_WICCF|nr:Transposon Ty2-C Gag-Pol polyprotein [Wickerhamomyces ciferrii]CCH45213.1 Transposon Ty2-C Gag-Pol polyprotein [Wickerhamomyces ciferrii]